MEKRLWLRFKLLLLFVICWKFMTTSLLASGSAAVSFILVTLEVTNTVSMWMPHYSRTVAYMLGPERPIGKWGGENYICMPEAAIKSLGAVHTLFQSPLRVLGTYCWLLLQTMEIWHSLERRQLPCRDCKPRRIDTCYRKQGSYFSHPLLLQQQPTSTSWPCTLRKHSKNIISLSCLLPPVPWHPGPCCTGTVTFVWFLKASYYSLRETEGNKTLVRILWNRRDCYEIYFFIFALENSSGLHKTNEDLY